MPNPKSQTTTLCQCRPQQNALSFPSIRIKAAAPAVAPLSPSQSPPRPFSSSSTTPLNYPASATVYLIPSAPRSQLRAPSFHQSSPHHSPQSRGSSCHVEPLHCHLVLSSSFSDFRDFASDG